MSSIVVRAPSNIALIKYMGKESVEGNLPANGSLSMTLDALCTVVEFRPVTAPLGTRFVPEAPAMAGWMPHPTARVHSPKVPPLSEKGTERMLRHVERVRRALPTLLSTHGLGSVVPSSHWEIRSANTFPAASGIASSASSFAAVTLASALAFSVDRDQVRRAYESSADFRRSLARLSREGSGSSCRSFEGPFVGWEGERAERCESRLAHYVDLVLVAGAGEKEVSSSEAHLQVMSSPLWAGRTKRVESRLGRLRQALSSGEVAVISKVAWEELWEMHSLFHTATTPFTYWLPESVAILRWLQKQDLSRVFATMDAGPNVHLLVPAAEREAWVARVTEAFPKMDLLVDSQGSGASILSGGGR